MTTRTFTLRHTDDHTGITTDLAHGAVFTDGTAVLHWADTIADTAVYTSLDDLQAANIRDSSTTVVDGAGDFATIEKIVELTLQRDDLAEACCQARAALHAAQARIHVLEATAAGTDQQEQDGQPHPSSAETPTQDAFLSQECARLQHENEQLRAENDNYRLTADQDKTYLDNADAQVGELREQLWLLLAETRGHEDTEARLRKERDGLQRELADLRHKSDDTLTAAPPTSGQVSRAEAQNKALARRCADLEAEVTRLARENEQLARKYGEANRYMEKFAADAHALRTTADADGKRVEAAEQTIKTMGAQLDEAAAREASLRAELDEANTAGTRMLEELYDLRTTSARRHFAARRDAQTLKDTSERETALRADVSRLAAGEKRWKNKALLVAELAAQYRDELEQLNATRTVRPADQACPCLPKTSGNLPDPKVREADQAHAEGIAGDQHDADALTSATSHRAGGHTASTKVSVLRKVLDTYQKANKGLAADIDAEKAEAAALRDSLRTVEEEICYLTITNKALRGALGRSQAREKRMEAALPADTAVQDLIGRIAALEGERDDAVRNAEHLRHQLEAETADRRPDDHDAAAEGGLAASLAAAAAQARQLAATCEELLDRAPAEPSPQHQRRTREPAAERLASGHCRHCREGCPACDDAAPTYIDFMTGHESDTAQWDDGACPACLEAAGVADTLDESAQRYATWSDLFRKETGPGGGSNCTAASRALRQAADTLRNTL